MFWGWMDLAAHGHPLCFLTAARVDHIQFGDCHIGKPYQATFTITNRSRAEAMRFEWPAGPPFHFSPQVSSGSSAFPTTQTLPDISWDPPATFHVLVPRFSDP